MNILRTKSVRNLWGFCLINNSKQLLRKTQVSRFVPYKVSYRQLSILSSYGEFIQKVVLDIESSKTIQFVQNSLIELHDFTGLPWWANIALTTFAFRTLITLPLSIYQQKVLQRYLALSREMEIYAKKLSQELPIQAYAHNLDRRRTSLVFKVMVGAKL